MTRRTWVQHPETGKLVPLEEVDWDRSKVRQVRHQHIIPDIEPFVSPVDGSVVSSRSHLRAHNDRNDVVNFHEFDGHWEQAAKERKAAITGAEGKASRTKALIQAYDQHTEKK